jgi:hypothetical protein
MEAYRRQTKRIPHAPISIQHDMERQHQAVEEGETRNVFKARDHLGTGIEPILPRDIGRGVPRVGYTPIIGDEQNGSGVEHRCQCSDLPPHPTSGM